MVPTYIVLVVVYLMASEARIFIGYCSYGFCEQECKEYKDMRMECYCRRGHVIKADGRRCLKTDDTEDDLAASGQEASGQDIEVSNCDNEDGDCDSTLLPFPFPFSGDGGDSDDDEGGSGAISTIKEDILPSISAILPHESVTQPSPDNIPHIISFAFNYPTKICFARLNTDPEGFKNSIRYQIAFAASVDVNTLTDFEVSCGSIDVKMKLVKASNLTVRNAVRKMEDLVSSGKLGITIDGQIVKPVKKSFTSQRDPAYTITKKTIEKTVKPIQIPAMSIEKSAEKPIQIFTTSIDKAVEKPIQISTTSTIKVNTLTNQQVDKLHTPMEASVIKSTQTLTKSYLSIRDTITLFTDKYLPSTLISTQSIYAKKGVQTTSSTQASISIIESKDTVQSFVASIVNSTQKLPASSTTHLKKILSYEDSAGQSSVPTSLSSLELVSTSVQEILPLPKPFSKSVHKSISTSSSSLKSVEQILPWIKPSSTSVHKSLSTVLSPLKSSSTSSVKEILIPLKPSSTSLHKLPSTSSEDVSSLLKTSIVQIKDESEIVSKPLETIRLLVPKKANKTTIVASKSTILRGETAETYSSKESTSEILIPQQVTTVKELSATTSTPLKEIVQSSSIIPVSRVSGGTLDRTKETSKASFSTIATTTPLDAVVKHVVTTSMTTDIRPKQTSSISQTTLGTSFVDVKIGARFVSTSQKSSHIAESSEIKLYDRITSSITISTTTSSAPSELQPKHTPVVIGSSPLAFKGTTELHKYTIQTSKPVVSSETMQSTFKQGIQSSPSKVVTETEPVIKVITLKKYDQDGKASRECRLLADRNVLLTLTSFIIYLLVLR